MAYRLHVWTQEVFDSADDLAERNKHRVRSTAHLLFGIVDRGDRMSRMLEQEYKTHLFDAERLLRGMKFTADHISPDYIDTDGYKQAIELAEELSHSSSIAAGGIHPEHLLAAILLVNDEHTQTFVRRFDLPVEEIIARLVKVPDELRVRVRAQAQAS